MKNAAYMVIADRYARAFLNVNRIAMTAHIQQRIMESCDFLKKNHTIVFYLSLAAVSKEKKTAWFEAFLKRFELFPLLNGLVRLLLKNNRLFLMVDVLQKIIEQMNATLDIHHFVITSSHEMRVDQLETIRIFLEKKIGGTIVYEHQVDPSLIGGLRVQSTTRLWEYSIRKQLHNALLPLIR